LHVVQERQQDRPVTSTERLLDLILEYQAAKDARSDGWGAYGALATPTDREPAEIAADFAAALRELLED
jgi:hypothetical protein